MDRSMQKRGFFIGFGVLFIGCFVALSAARKEAASVGAVVGIDLDTADSSAAVVVNGRVEIVEDEQGRRTIPSWVAFDGDQILVGEAAKNQAAFNPRGTVFGVKRIIGRRFNDIEVQREIQRVPYKIVNKNGKPYIEVEMKAERVKVFSPEEISAMILNKMKENAEAFLEKKISDVVMAVPAHFYEEQRQATVRAGELAGLNVVMLINEPNAVAIAYGLHEEGRKKNVVVFDLGGGTSDVSILNVDRGDIATLAVHGDAHLGGENFDERVAQHFVKLFEEKHGKDISGDVNALNRLRREAESVRLRLNYESSVQVVIPFLFEGLDFSGTLTRDEFEELNDDLFKRIIEHVAMAVSSSGLRKSQIDEILLSGGGAKIPKVQQLLEEYFNGKKPRKDVDPDVVVAHGVAIKGASLGRVISFKSNQ